MNSATNQTQSNQKPSALTSTLTSAPTPTPTPSQQTFPNPTPPTPKYHFIGIGGIGMSGLARILLDQKIQVTGSDLNTNDLIEELRNSGAHIYPKHTAENISPDSTIVYTSGIKKNNPEFLSAIDKKCPILHRSDLLQLLMKNKKALAVTGTHGKTTTSSLLAWVLTSAGLDPSYALGGVLCDTRKNSRYGKGEYFVAEADESDGSFLAYDPEGVIVTNIGLDHLDYYKTESEIITAFKKFFGKVRQPNLIFWCGDDPRLKSINPPGHSYGLSNSCEFQAVNIRQTGWTISFDVINQNCAIQNNNHCNKNNNYSNKNSNHSNKNNNHFIKNIQLPIIGKHNVLNALAVFALAKTIGISEDSIKEAFATFPGVSRRCEKKGSARSITVVDDYGHHPTEIATTLRGLKSAEPNRRLVVLFQPHRYTRTRDCLGLFAQAFSAADLLFVTDIYSAGEDPIPGVTSEKLISEVACEAYVTSKENTVSDICNKIRPHDLVLTLGAGDVTYMGPKILQMIEQRGITKYKIAVLSGGRSVEHDISLKSAANIANSLSKELYEVTSHFISREGIWEHKEIAESADIIIPALHGTFGEDGTIQGYFEILDKPYVGPDFRSAAITMDKLLTKTILQYHGIRTSPFVGFSESDWRVNRSELLERVDKELVYPVFVKATHLGSSIGVYKVNSFEELSSAIESVFVYDTHAIVENGIKGREIEFAVIGNDEVTVFPPGEVCTQGQVYDFKAKYGDQGFGTMVEANLSKDKVNEGMALVKKAYQVIGCTGMARIDTFFDENQNFWINEINPIPGFTAISLFPKMCQAHGLDGERLIDTLVCLALARHRNGHKKMVEMVEMVEGAVIGRKGK